MVQGAESCRFLAIALVLIIVFLASILGVIVVKSTNDGIRYRIGPEWHLQGMSFLLLLCILAIVKISLMLLLLLYYLLLSMLILLIFLFNVFISLDKVTPTANNTIMVVAFILALHLFDFVAVFAIFWWEIGPKNILWCMRNEFSRLVDLFSW